MKIAITVLLIVLVYLLYYCWLIEGALESTAEARGLEYSAYTVELESIKDQMALANQYSMKAAKDLNECNEGKQVLVQELNLMISKTDCGKRVYEIGKIASKHFMELQACRGK